jgi:hypothetical protein
LESCDGAGSLGGVVIKTFGADGAGLGVDVEVGSLGAGNASPAIPDGLIVGAFGAEAGSGVNIGSGRWAHTGTCGGIPG